MYKNPYHTWFFGMLFLNKFFLFLLKISYNGLLKKHIKSQITLGSLLHVGFVKSFEIFY